MFGWHKYTGMCLVNASGKIMYPGMIVNSDNVEWKKMCVRCRKVKQ